MGTWTKWLNRHQLGKEPGICLEHPSVSTSVPPPIRSPSRLRATKGGVCAWLSRKSWKLGIVGGCVIRRREGPRHLLGGGASLSLESGGRGCVGAELWSWVFLGGASSLQNVVCFSLRGSQFYCPCHPRLHTAVMAQQPPDVEGDDCLSEYHHLFCPDLLQ